ncbi:MAG: YkgJ family cysteine cluster protein [Desulfovibrio sp.]|nr:MAG: YkgJ family cysteine cluster protein [Desulfovibrio sp.]
MLNLAQRKPKFPVEEERLPWLSMLLDALWVIDRGVAASLPKHVAENPGQAVACHKGCHACCLDNDIPVTPLEAVGITWFVAEKAARVVKADVLTALQAFPHRANTEAGCPFVLNGNCLVYPVRPIACRNYIVFSVPCALGEDPTETRPGDVLRPIGSFARQAFRLMLPYYGFHQEQDLEQAVRDKYLFTVTGSMHRADWSRLKALVEASVRGS